MDNRSPSPPQPDTTEAHRRQRGPGRSKISLLLLAAVLLGVLFFPVPGDQPGLDEHLLPLSLVPNQLTVLTRNIPTAYYIGPEGPTGFEYDLVSDLARHLQLKLKIVVVPSVRKLLTEMAAGRADLAAGGLTRTPERERHFSFGPDYFPVRQQVVYRKGSRHPRNLEELQRFTPLVLARSSYVERLQELKKRYPGLHWRTTDEYSTDQLLEMIWQRRLALTVSDSNILAINRRFYPELRAAFALSRKQPLAWIINDRLPRLKKEIFRWFKEFKRRGRLAETVERYYSHTALFDYVDIKVFIRRIHTRLPAFRPYLEKYGRLYHIPWTLLAAKAYQESHWDPLATSPTGVRGLMMLTETTAAELGITDRLNAEESVRGGARYLRQLYDRVPGNYDGRDHWKVATAAYNLGIGHIYDSRELARRQHLDPDRWLSLKKVLPLLSQEKYYQQLKYGYARGQEAVRYVERIDNYREILEKALQRREKKTKAATAAVLR